MEVPEAAADEDKLADEDEDEDEDVEEEDALAEALAGWFADAAERLDPELADLIACAAAIALASRRVPPTPIKKQQQHPTKTVSKELKR